MADEGGDLGTITPGQDTGNTPSIDADPQNPSGPGVAPASPVGDNDYYATQQSDIMAKHHEREEYYRNAMESHIKALERAATQSDAEIAAQKQAQPQVASPQMQRQQQIGQQLQGGGGQGNGVGGAIMGIIALGAVAAAAFGSKKNPYIQGALMGGVGAMMHNYARARHDKVAELKQEWHQLNEYNNAQNRERLQNERAVLADKRLDLQQQMDILKTYGQLYNDERLIGDADSRNVARVQKNLDDKEKAAQYVDKKAHQGGFNSGERAAYRMDVIEQSHGTLDPAKDADLSTALQRYPYSDFLKKYYTEKEQAKKAAKDSTSKDQGAIGKNPNDRLGLGLGQ